MINSWCSVKTESESRESSLISLDVRRRNPLGSCDSSRKDEKLPFRGDDALPFCGDMLPFRGDTLPFRGDGMPPLPWRPGSKAMPPRTPECPGQKASLGVYW